MLVDKVLRFIQEAHTGQYRDDGITEYWTHPAAVKEIAFSILGRKIPKILSEVNSDYNGVIIYTSVLALTHDIAEDVESFRDNEKLVVEEIKKLDTNNELGMFIDILEPDLKALNKNYSENYLSYIIKISNNLSTSIVKLADLIHNSKDLKDGSARKDKYLLAQHILKSAQNV